METSLNGQTVLEMSTDERISFDLAGNPPNRQTALRNLQTRFSFDFQDGLLDALVDDAFDLAKGDTLPEDSYNRGKGWRFQLVRRLMKHILKGERAGMGQGLAPLAALFTELLSVYKSLKPCELDCSSIDEILIAFEAEWNRVRFAEGEFLLGEAYEEAVRNPCIRALTSLMTVVSMGYYLQQMGDGKRFYLPVNAEVAELIGLSEKHVSNCIKVAIDRKYFIQQTDCIPNKRARLFKFDTSHPDLYSCFRR